MCIRDRVIDVLTTECVVVQASHSQHFSGDPAKATALQNMMKLVQMSLMSLFVHRTLSVNEILLCDMGLMSTGQEFLDH